MPPEDKLNGDLLLTMLKFNVEDALHSVTQFYPEEKNIELTIIALVSLIPSLSPQRIIFQVAKNPPYV